MVLTFKNNKRRTYHFCTDLARDQLHTLNQNLSAIPINESIQKKNIKNLININENMEKVIAQQAHVSVSKQDFLLFKNIEKQAGKQAISSSC